MDKERVGLQVELKTKDEIIESFRTQIECGEVAIKAKDEQIQKMKCCGNCSNGIFNGVMCFSDEEIVDECKANNYKYWECRE